MSEQRLPGAIPGGVPSADELERRPEVTDREIDEGDLAALGGHLADGGPEIDPLTERDLRSGETDDPDVAAEEGLAWVPPIDPPTGPAPQADGDPTFAAGFGVDALAEPYDSDHREGGLSSEDQVTELVRDALRADARTTALADELMIAHLDDRIVIAGTVEDLDDEDDVVEVASRVRGVEDVESRLAVRAVDETTGA